MVSLHYEYLLGIETIRGIIKDVCEQLWLCIQPVAMPNLDQNGWLNVATEYYNKTQFPNCIGSVDGKHIRICQPTQSGSLFYNYKNFFSIVLLGIVDANYCFISVDIGSYGSCSDSTAFKHSALGQKLEKGQLNLPLKSTLPGDDGGTSMPFVLVGDEAFALSDHLLRPYPRRELTQTKKIFNYRLTRARRMVECAFGILANKWRILHRPLNVNPDFCDNIIKACCVLHNYVRQRDGITFDDAIYECPLQSLNANNVRTRMSAISNRDYFSEYFISPHGSVPWQYEKI